jgi:asparagine synthetase B (glutamine-hydrolysing)
VPASSRGKPRRRDLETPTGPLRAASPVMKLRGARKDRAALLAEPLSAPELLERPKTCFEVPIHRWLRCRDWLENLLDEQRSEREGCFNLLPIRNVWQSLLSGRSEWAYGGELLWACSCSRHGWITPTELPD